ARRLAGSAAPSGVGPHADLSALVFVPSAATSHAAAPAYPPRARPSGVASPPPRSAGPRVARGRISGGAKPRSLPGRTDFDRLRRADDSVHKGQDLRGVTSVAAEDPQRLRQVGRVRAVEAHRLPRTRVRKAEFLGVQPLPGQA